MPFKPKLRTTLPRYAITVPFPLFFPSDKLRLDDKAPSLFRDHQTTGKRNLPLAATNVNHADRSGNRSGHHRPGPVHITLPVPIPNYIIETRAGTRTHLSLGSPFSLSNGPRVAHLTSSPPRSDFASPSHVSITTSPVRLAQQNNWRKKEERAERKGLNWSRSGLPELHQGNTGEAPGGSPTSAVTVYTHQLLGFVSS
ncbi:hypothetical protein VUR80DRAFT_282 [Thermomyces stellatus]